jgi:hypothetical protein
LGFDEISDIDKSKRQSVRDIKDSKTKQKEEGFVGNALGSG